jgi:hypothetical protein
MSENLNGRDHLKDLGTYRIIILKWILRNRVRSCRLDSCGSEQGMMVGSCEHGNEPSRFHKRWGIS